MKITRFEFQISMYPRIVGNAVLLQSGSKAGFFLCHLRDRPVSCELLESQIRRVTTDVEEAMRICELLDCVSERMHEPLFERAAQLLCGTQALEAPDVAPSEAAPSEAASPSKECLKATWAALAAALSTCLPDAPAAALTPFTPPEVLLLSTPKRAKMIRPR